MHTKILSSLALSAALVLGMSGCGSSSDDAPAEVIPPATGAEFVHPYERVAVLDGDWSGVLGIADTIARYVVNTDESDVLGFPTNWVIAGANPAGGETYETSDLLPIPVGTNKSRVVELCNGAYAKQATGTGQFHGPALPCEISVHSDGEKIYVDMLNADAIFTLFFQDLSDEQKLALKSVAADVKHEIRTMALEALTDKGTAHEPSTEAMGPKYDLNSELPGYATMSPYRVYEYSNPQNLTAKDLAKSIIESLGTDDETADTHVDGLTEGSAWRSARPEPIAIPGIFITEACSPKYAKLATALGSQYITALPCEIGVYVDVDTNKTMVSYLDPEFMFGAMFADAFSELNATELEKYRAIPGDVFSDLEKIVNHALSDGTLTEQ